MRAVLLLAVAELCFAQEPRLRNAALPELVKRALDFVPVLKADQVVVLERPADLAKYLTSWGYSKEAAAETVREIQGLAEFTIDHRFPVFINASSLHYRRILLSWQFGRFPDQAARILASDLYHEYRHAACGEEEAAALTAHVKLLKEWRSRGLLLIADPYIRAKERELQIEQEQEKRGDRASPAKPKSCQ